MLFKSALVFPRTNLEPQVILRPQVNTNVQLLKSSNVESIIFLKIEKAERIRNSEKCEFHPRLHRKHFVCRSA